MQKALLAVEDLTPEEQAELQAIRDRKIKIVAAHRRKKSAANNHPMLPHKADKERTATTENMKVQPNHFNLLCKFSASKYACSNIFHVAKPVLGNINILERMDHNYPAGLS